MGEQLAGKVVLVTGAGSGIGRATAVEFGARGASVMVADLSADGAAETVDELARVSATGQAVIVDVSDEPAVEKMVASTVATFGRLDYLVNNAGITSAGPPGPLHDITLDAFQRVLVVNLVSCFLTMKHAIPKMLETGGGAVVNVASTMAERASAGDPSYTTSKYGLRGLTQSAALTYAEAGVRVNSVGPGMIKTPMTERVFSNEQTAAHLRTLVPLRRFAEASEVAKLIAFLCSDDASYITGCYYPVDGGMLAG